MMKTLFVASFLYAASAVACSGRQDVHTPSAPPEIGAGSTGSPCSGRAVTHTTECPYYACLCNQGGLDGCTDDCQDQQCQDAATTCDYVCRSRGGVDHVEPATHALCD